MKVLFQASILHREERLGDYVAIVASLKKFRCQVLGEALTVSKEEIARRSHVERVRYFEKFKSQLLESDLVCFEATYPSTLHLGIKLAYALQKGKPVMVLYKKTTFPEMFVDAFESDKLFYEEYSQENVDQVVKLGLDFVEKKSDVRFNFYLPANLADFIEKISKEADCSKTTVLRNIIKENMENVNTNSK